MRFLTISGFLLVCVALAWLGVNQQETNAYLRTLVAENRKLSDTLAKQGAALEAANAAAQARAVEARPFSNRNLGGRLSLTRPSGLIPGGNRLTAQPQDTEADAGSLSSHSAEGKLL